MVSSIVLLIYWFLTLFSWGLFLHIILGYFLDPYHPLRQFTARIYEPMLALIRPYIPQAGMLDLSPIVLFMLVYLLRQLILMLF
jgi:YggT family protein